MPTWDDAQEDFSRGAGPMSRGSDGSPVNFIDNDTCDTAGTKRGGRLASNIR